MTNNQYNKLNTSRRLLLTLYNLFGSNKIFKKGRENLIKYNESIVKHLRLQLTGDKNEIIFGKGSIVENLKIFMSGKENSLIIGDYCHIKGGNLWIEGDNCAITIGDRTTIESAHLACTEKTSISLGNDCMIANDVDIRTGDSHSLIDLADQKRYNFAKNVDIKDHVWIAARAIILKGVTIGQSSVVATGAVVTKDVPSGCIFGGNPAKILKENITWKRERI